MSEIPSPNYPDGTEHATGNAVEIPRSRKRRAGRIALIAVLSVLLVFGAAIAGTYVAISHLTSNIRRIPNVFAGLNAADRPVMPVATRHSMTVLLTGSPLMPPITSGNGPLGSSQAPQHLSGMVMLLHLNADGRTGAIVSVPSNTIVRPPGHGRILLEDTLTVGGPALMITAVEHLTHVRINHFAVIDFNHVSDIVNTLGGVNVRLRAPSISNGIAFHRGVNHVYGQAALAYARQPGVAGGDEGRTLRQSSLMRAVFRKIAVQHLLTNPLTSYQVLNAMTQALSVDSDFTNAELRSLIFRLRDLGSRNGTFVMTPVRNVGLSGMREAAVLPKEPEAAELWSAIRNDAVAEYAQQYPHTVTPLVPR